MIAQRYISRGLRLSGFLCASVSLAALVFHVLGGLPMAFFLTFFGVPSFILLLMLTVVGRWLDEETFLNCLVVGTVGGIVATIAYDAVRMLLSATRLFDYDAFYAITIFGQWITGHPAGTLQAGVAGWLYHYWNGISFGVLYMLTFGRHNWLYGVGYGLIMEVCMLGLFPLFLQIRSPVSFVVISLAGHMVYGGVLGRFGQVYGQSWQIAGEPHGG